MRMRKLAGGDLAMSVLGLGCLEFGSGLRREESFAVLDAYTDAGGRFLDTANNYSFWVDGCRGGESESLLGEWMRERHNRHELVLATKVGARPTVQGGGLESAEGLGAKAIISAVEGSLRRLGVDAIDLYYAHIEDAAVPQAETLGAFERLREAGKVREIGCSNHAVQRIEEARRISHEAGWHPYRALQQRFSWLQPRPSADLGVQKLAGEDVRAYVRAHPDITLVAYSALLGGAYAGGDLPKAYDTAENADRRRRLNALAGEAGITPSQLVLNWMVSRENAIPLIASRSPARLKECIAACDLRVDPNILDRLSH